MASETECAVSIPQAPAALEYLLRPLHWAGVLRHLMADRWSGRAFYARKAAAMAAIAIFLSSQALALWRGGTADLDSFTLVLSTFNTIITWLFRLGHIAVQERQLHYLADQVDRDFGDFLSPRDVQLMETRDANRRRFVLAYIWFSTAGCMWWITFPVLRFGFCAAGLPFILELPYEVSSPHTFIPTWLFCSLITIHTAVFTTVVDSFNISLIAQLRVQLIILSRNIVDLANEEQDTKSATFKHISGSKRSPDRPNGIRIVSQLRKMILHHQAIIRNTEELERCLGVMLLGQTLSNGAAVCFALFQVALSAGSLAEAGKFGCYLSVTLAQLFVYCWFGDELITESENVSLAAYSAVTSLPGIPVSQKRSLLLLMVRAQRPLRITAGGFFPLSRESFVSSAESLAEAGKFGCYLSVTLAQLFVYCWFGDELITESENVSLAAYSVVTSLQGIPVSQKRSLLLLMVRAQRPLRITAGGFFPLSRESFVSVVNMSYSFFAILRNFKAE